MFDNDPTFDPRQRPIDSNYYDEGMNANPVDLANIGDPSPGAGFDLSQFDDDYDEIEVDENGFDRLPNGKYQAEIKDAALKININGDHMISWQLEVLNSEYAGCKVWRNGIIKSKDNLRYLKKDLLLCGLILDRFSELPKHLHKLRGLRLEITKKASGEFSNIFFNKRLVSAPQPKGDVPY